jgi:hypothetical protein
MKKRIFRASLFAIVIVFGIWIYRLSGFSIEESDLEKHMAEQFRKTENMKTGIEIEEIRDIGNYRTFLFSVHEGDVPDTDPKLGFAFYEKSRLGNKYRFDGMGWGTNPFDGYLFEASAGNKRNKFLVVYGRNPSESKEYERFEFHFHDETFVGNLPRKEYFVEVFPVTHHTKEGAVTEIHFETRDHEVTSFPLPITSLIH